MKTKIEVLGYVIEVEETEGVVTVKAEFDGETVEDGVCVQKEAEEIIAAWEARIVKSQ